MANRKQRGRGRSGRSGQLPRGERAWKDETNPTRDASDPSRDEQPSSAEPRSPGERPSPAAPIPEDPNVPATRRAEAGRPDQGQKWQTGPGSGGATESAGRLTEHEGRSDQAGPKR